MAKYKILRLLVPGGLVILLLLLWSNHSLRERRTIQASQINLLEDKVVELTSRTNKITAEAALARQQADLCRGMIMWDNATPILLLPVTEEQDGL